MSVSDRESQWQSNLYSILPHPTEARILLLPGETGWTLPRIQLAGEVWTGDLVQVNHLMGQKLNVRATLLRYVNFKADEEKRRTEVVCLLENHAPAKTPPLNGEWVGADRLAQVSLALPEHQAVIERYLKEAESGLTSAGRVPWAQKGWFAGAEVWMRAQLAALGYTLVAPVEQAKSWSLACLLRAQTTDGDIYFKQAAALPLFVNEPVVMTGLAELYPRHVPGPLAIDREQGWMLLADFGNELGWDAPLAVREEVLCLFGQMQRQAIERVDDLLALGCLDRRLERLAGQIDPLLNDAEILSGLSAVEKEKLRSFGPQLKTMCDQLASYNLPQTLMHGDLHLSNVALQGENYLFFDWTDACVAHPFLDMIDILREEDTAIQARLRDSYLALWTDYEPMARLQEMWALVEPLAALHQAVSYQYIIAHVEAGMKQEFTWARSFFLRKILQSVEKIYPV